MGGGLAVLKSDWSTAGLRMDLCMGIYEPRLLSSCIHSLTNLNVLRNNR